MVAKISFGSSLYGALAYNGEKINKEEGKLLATNKIFDDCSGKTSITNALRDFLRYLSPHIRTEKPVVHISLNPHPDDVLTDMDMENIAREYLERMGYGNQPYMVYKHEDIDRHHMHIVTIRVDENGKCLDSRYNYHKSKAITRDLEEKYNLNKADRKQCQADNPLRKVDISQGYVKKQVANTVKSLCATYRFQSLGEYRALLSLYNISLEEVRGEVGGREYHGFVYSATDGQGNKVGNPFKASKIDRSVGAEAIEKRFAYSAKKFKEDKKLSEMTRHSVEAVLKQTYHKDKFVELLKAKGIDVVFRHTADGRIYGATFIDHRTQSVFNGSRLGTNLSANAIQEHFSLPYENEQPIPLTIPKEEWHRTFSCGSPLWLHYGYCPIRQIKKSVTELYRNNVVTLFIYFFGNYLFASTILAILTLTSYSKYNGIVTKTRVIKSGGVIIAATSIMTIKACFLYLANSCEDMNPNFAKKNIITGN